MANLEVEPINSGESNNNLEVTGPELQGGTPISPVVGAQPVQPAVNTKDLSGSYANVGGTIYNTQSGQAYDSAQEFFKASGQSSFNGLTFNTNWKPPTGFNKTQQQAKTTLAGANLSEEDLNNGSTVRGILGPQAAAQPLKLADGSVYDTSGNQITPPTAQNQPAAVTSNQPAPGSTLPPNLQALIPSNAAYDDQAAFANTLTQANALIQKFTTQSDPNALVDTFNSARAAVGLPALENGIAGLQSAIESTPDDITAELKASGGMVDQSDVEYMSSIRDKALNDQLTTLTNLASVQNDYVDQVTSLTGQDEQNTNSNFEAAFNTAAQIQQIQENMDATGATQRMQNIQFAQANNISKPYYSVGGTVYNTATGFAYSSPAQAAAAGVDTTGWSNVQPLAGAGINPSNLIKVTLPDGSTGLYNAQTGTVVNFGDTGAGAPAQGSLVTGNGAYDISTYDPSNANYPTTVQQIASGIQNSGIDTSTTAGIDSYIQEQAPGSPITGDMVTQAAEQYGVDPTAMMALMQEENNFNTGAGTTDIANNNPFSIGPGYNYPTLQDGVNAGAQWLSNHPAKTSSSAALSPEVQGWVTNVQNGSATLTNVPAGMRTEVSTALANSNTPYTPLADSRFTNAANRIVSNYTQLPAYQLVAGGQLYLGRIAAAMKTPGSISDQDLLDSLTKLNTGGNAISDAQVKLITDGQSYSDWASVLSNKLSTGGVLSDSQRSQISTLASNIFASYQTAYQPIYNQVTSQLESAGIPKEFWTIPDLNTLSADAGQSATGSSSQNDPYAPQINLNPEAVSTLDSLVP